MKIAVMGAGGVGGYFGALLARAGHSVTFIARGPHLAAIRERGLRVESTLDGAFTIHCQAVEDTTGAGTADLVLFTVKMYHNAEAIEAIRPMMAPHTVLLTLQSGIDNGEQLAQAFGAPRVMIGSAYLEGRIKEPGVVTQGGPGMVAFGEMEPGITPRGQGLLEVFREAGWRVDLHENMPGMLWKKFAAIAGSGPVCAAAKRSVYEDWPLRSIPETRALIQGAVEEVLAVGRARGAPIMADSLESAMTLMDRFPAQGRAGLAKAFLAESRVELEGITGAVIRMGREVGVPTPINAAHYAILKPWAVRIESQLVGG